MITFIIGATKGDVTMVKDVEDPEEESKAGKDRNSINYLG
jgi:hypothetical protein